MVLIIETGRLLLREFTLDDAPLLYRLNLDPEVIRYTYDPIRDIDHAREILEKTILPQYTLYNYGRWAVLLKSDNQFLGWCGLKYIPKRNEVDLGYRFQRQAWGKGYATEAAAACISYSFKKLDLSRIIARAIPENLASLNVMEKCGMSFLSQGEVDGYMSKTYEILKPSIP